MTRCCSDDNALGFFLCNSVWSFLGKIAQGFFTCAMFSQEYHDNIKQDFSMANVVWSFLDNIAQGFFSNLCNVVPGVLRQHWSLSGAYWITLHVFTCACGPKCVKRTLKKTFSCAMLSRSPWVNIAHGNHLCNVSTWLTDNFYEENNLYNVVSTMLGQHCIEILSNQCCPDTSETTLHKKIACAMLAQSTQTCFCRKTTHTMLSWSTWANIAQENCLYNVDPRSMNYFT